MNGYVGSWKTDDETETGEWRRVKGNGKMEKSEGKMAKGNGRKGQLTTRSIRFAFLRTSPASKLQYFFATNIGELLVSG